MVAGLERESAGAIRDVVRARGRLFAVGERGLLVLGEGALRVVDSVDVAARRRIDTFGRHLVSVGDGRVQVVDTTPFAASRTASRAP